MKLSSIFFVILIATVSPFITCFASDKQDHISINNNYSTLSNGFEHSDLEAIKQVYTDQAVYISETQDKDILIGKDKILALYQSFFTRINHKKAHLEVDFRIISRQFDVNSVTDVGYYLVRFHPSAETGESVSEFAGKMVTVSNKNAQGIWLIHVDSNTRADAKFYFNAKPVSNLYYGRQFSR